MKRLLAVTTLGLATFLAGEASAQSIIKNPGDHPEYKVELEPHGIVAWPHLYVDYAFGLGMRAAIPIVDNGFISSINNNVAISFGLDWARYSGCYYYDNRGRGRLGYGCGASFFILPVTMQWNFWLTPKWSVFGEPGLYIYHGIFDDFCDPAFPGCRTPNATGIGPAFYAGGRFHFSEKVSLTMRIGYPVFLSVGASFFL